MEKDVVRLESLKLAVSRTTDHSEALARAKEYEDFINNGAKIVHNVDPASANMTAGKDGKRPAQG